MSFELRHYQRGKVLMEQGSAGGSLLEYGRQYRLASTDAAYRFVAGHLAPDDPPAWDVLFALFPEDREALEERMLYMLKEVLCDAQPS